ncbi:hypothetical protein BGAL_0290g00070 [Botrytis galanthina]|uniref:Uncharacterized protein n=1 Tax=Botrytis galanthina TaxID=278940 RepID=A0A4S8QTT9_9HELO|nr:hypothetical protein BGAL_0290g00070 [Botrytis galanthina]
MENSLNTYLQPNPLPSAGTLTRYWVQTAGSRVLLPEPKYRAWNGEEEGGEEAAEAAEEAAAEADEEQGRRLLWTLTRTCLKVTMSHFSCCSW